MDFSAWRAQEAKLERVINVSGHSAPDRGFEQILQLSGSPGAPTHDGSHVRALTACRGCCPASPCRHPQTPAWTRRHSRTHPISQPCPPSRVLARRPSADDRRWSGTGRGDRQARADADARVAESTVPKRGRDHKGGPLRVCPSLVYVNLQSYAAFGLAFTSR